MGGRSAGVCARTLRWQRQRQRRRCARGLRNVTRGGYWSSGTPCGDANGNDGCIAAGADLAAAQAYCCTDPLCAGFSWGVASVPGGCYKFSQTCYEANAAYDGYWKPGFVPPPPPFARTLATTYSAYGSHAIVVVATWCRVGVNATVAIDWRGLGLDASAAVVTAPAIAGVQPAAGPLSVVDGAVNVYLAGDSGGILLDIRVGSQPE